jgi:hypothetical protein
MRLYEIENNLVNKINNITTEIYQLVGNHLHKEYPNGINKREYNLFPFLRDGPEKDEFFKLYKLRSELSRELSKSDFMDTLHFEDRAANNLGIKNNPSVNPDYVAGNIRNIKALKYKIPSSAKYQGEIEVTILREGDERQFPGEFNESVTEKNVTKICNKYSLELVEASTGFSETNLLYHTEEVKDFAKLSKELNSCVNEINFYYSDMNKTLQKIGSGSIEIDPYMRIFSNIGREDDNLLAATDEIIDFLKGDVDLEFLAKKAKIGD